MDYSKVLRGELIPAFGCTEPIALALAAAKAGSYLEKDAKSMTAIVSANIYKNAHSVTVPSCNGQKGLGIALMAGLLLGDPDKDLEVLNGIDSSRLNEANQKLEDGFLDIKIKPGETGVYVEIILDSIDEKVRLILSGAHNHISYVEKDGKVLLEDFPEDAEDNLVDYNFDSIYEYADKADLSPIKDILDKQIEYNTKISEEGLKNDWGSGIGKILIDSNNDNDKLAAYAAAGSDARMTGCEFPVVINAGSGNQGITVSMPLVVYAKEHGLDQEKLYRALTLSNLLSLYIKQGVGKLSAYCGAVSAASACGAGLAYLQGESKDVVAGTLSNSLATNSGILCDGAKASCAAKIASSLSIGFMSLEQAKRGKSFNSGDGMVKDSIDKMILSVGKIAKDGMKETDTVLLDEMLKD